MLLSNGVLYAWCFVRLVFCAGGVFGDSGLFGSVRVGSVDLGRFGSIRVYSGSIRVDSGSIQG